MQRLRIPLRPSQRKVTQRTGRGPNGLRVPAHTPAYSTAATVSVGTTAALQTALNAASSGQVIEFTGSSGTNVLLTGGSTGWTTNVLIRPTLGQRGAVSGWNLQAAHVTVAGFDGASGDFYRVNRPGHRSGFWRCTGEQSWGLFDCDDPFLVECVGQTFWADVALDRVNLFGGTGATYDLTRPTIDGCWFNGSSLPNGSQAHLDTLQIEGVNGRDVIDPTLRDTVLVGHPTINSPAQAASNIAGDFTVSNCYFGGAQYNAGALASDDRLHVTDSDFAGPLSISTAGRPAAVTFRRNRAASLVVGSANPVELGYGDNIIYINEPFTPTPLGNLTALWPGCPLVA